MRRSVMRDAKAAGRGTLHFVHYAPDWQEYCIQKSLYVVDGAFTDDSLAGFLCAGPWRQDSVQEERAFFSSLRDVGPGRRPWLRALSFGRPA